MHSLIAKAREIAQRVRVFSIRAWVWYRGRKRWQQIAIAAALLVLLIAAITLLRGGGPGESEDNLRTVRLESIGALSGTGSSVSIIGNVRSVTEADILAQNGGTVRRVNAQVGQTVGAGAIIAELENASERASVLQAEGAYESALAARAITRAQSGNASESLEEAETSARNTYRTAFTAIDSLLTVEVQSVFGGTSFTPGLLIGAGNAPRLGEEYRELRRTEVENWRRSLDTAASKNPETLLNEAERITQRLAAFLVELSRAAASADSGATATQKANIASARAEVDALLATISAERDALRAKQTAATVGSTQSVSTDGQVASADASVKSALGSLRAAQAQLEKTIVRAPIGGTVNFLPIRVGDYVTSFTHVATVARNNALEIVAYVSEDDRDLLSAGTKVTVEDDIPGVVTSVSPALDPVTKQIEVRVAVEGESELVNGQSVRIALPNVAAPTAEATEGPVLLPLAAVKLSGESRLVFTVGEDGRLAAREVTVGEVRGDRIEVTSSLPTEMRIVTDARGLAAGEKIKVKE